MTSFKRTGTLGSFTLGLGLSLAACTIEVPETDYDESGGTGAGGKGTAADTAGNTGGTQDGDTGPTSNATTRGEGSGGSTGSAAATGGGSAVAGSSGGSANTGGVGDAGSSGDESGDTPDNCAEHPSSDQTDTDSDGQGDVCDADDDQDGFLDQDDPEPLDIDVRGDFSTPEKVLDDPRVVEAIAGLLDAGFEFEAHLDTDAPDVTGYFRKEDGAGEFVANSGGGGVGVGVVGAESRTRLTENSTLESSRVAFTDGAPISFSIVTSQTLRGSGNAYTIYTTTRTVCTEAGSNHVRFQVSIDSGTVDGDGNLIDNLGLNVTVATQGELTSDCASRANGLIENENEWTASLVPLHTKLEVSELEYMCVDGDAAFAPTERWVRDDRVCECTLEYEISCGAA